MNNGNLFDHHQEVMSMEEYLHKRRRIKEQEFHATTRTQNIENPAWLLVEICE